MLVFNDLMMLIMFYEPDNKIWRSREMYASPSRTFKLTDTMNYKLLSYNPNVSPADIMARPEADWYWPALSAQFPVTLELLRATKNKWKWPILAQNPHITLEMVHDSPDLPWPVELSSNKIVTLKFVLEHQYLTWNYSELAKFIPINELDEIGIFASYTALSYNPTLTEKRITNSSSITLWCWDALSANPAISFEFLRKHAGLTNWIVASKREFVTIKLLMNNQDIKWNWYMISMYWRNGLQQIVDNRNLPWDFDALSQNDNITWEMVRHHIDMPWNWTHISRKPDLTWRDVIKFRNIVNWRKHCLIKNQFTKNKAVMATRLAKYYGHRWRLYAKGRNNQRQFMKDVVGHLRVFFSDVVAGTLTKGPFISPVGLNLDNDIIINRSFD